MRSILGAALQTVAAMILVLTLQQNAALGATTTIVSGSVIDVNGGLPIEGANVTLTQQAQVVATTKTDRDGAFTFKPVPEGVYYLTVRAIGYGVVNSEPIPVSGPTQSITLTMSRSTTSAVRQLGRVVVNTKGGGLQTTTTIQQQADPNVMIRTNKINTGYALGKLPSVNLIGQDSSLGDDLGVDVRGLKPSETQVLLDGHPIGPLGVYPASIGGGTGGFNWADSPLGSIQNTVVVYGSGATGLYGVDAVGGSVDLQTINPTQQAHQLLSYGIGSYGKQTFQAQATGSASKLGYAFNYGVAGTYGDFPSQNIYQAGINGGDLSPPTTTALTYPISADYLLRNTIGKVRYNFSPNTSLTLTGYTATSWDDKTGNGDNDYISYPFALFQAQQGPNCSTPTIPSGITITNSKGATQCVTFQHYAQLTTGPAGGGPGAYQALANQDYHARFLTALGKNQVVVDFFEDNSSRNKVRPASFVNGPTDIRFNIWHTVGYLVSDDITTNTNDFGFGFYSQRQYTNGNSGQGTPEAALFSRLTSEFIRDAWTPSTQIQYFLNAWLKDSLLGGMSFDPRLSIVWKPDSSNVIRLTGGKASADPAAIAVDLASVGGITPGNCNLFGIGTIPTPGELPEKSTDIEAAFAHRWTADTISQFTLYDTNEINTIFEANLPAAGYQSLISSLGGPTYIPAVYQKIMTLCPGFRPPNPPPTIANLVVTTNTNLSDSRSRGLDLSQRFRVNPHIVFDAFYDTQSTVVNDVPDFFLQENPTLINGAQLQGIPLHKFGLSADFSTTHGGDLFLQYTQFDSNNELNRPAYGEVDLSLSQDVARNTTLNFGVSNLFNAAVDNYGRIGLGVYVPENQFGTDQNAVEQGSERFGLAPASVIFTVTQHI